MNFLNNNPVGVDIRINNYQKSLYDQLTEKWGDIDGYGRVYKNIVKNGESYKPEYYLGDEDYESVFGSERTKFFFVKGDSEPLVANTNIFVVDMDLYFIVDVRPIVNDNRPDEQVLIDVMAVLDSLSIKVKRIKQGIKVLYNDFNRSIVQDTSNLKYSDLQPYHVFKVEFTMQYELSEKCSLI